MHEHAVVPQPTPGKHTLTETLPTARTSAPVQRSASSNAAPVAMPERPQLNGAALFGGHLRWRASGGDAGAQDTAAIQQRAANGDAASHDPAAIHASAKHGTSSSFGSDTTTRTPRRSPIRNSVPALMFAS
jgi:hypothetical protein